MNLFKLSATIKLDSDGYERAVKEAARKADAFEDALKDVGSASNSSGKDVNKLGDHLEDAAKATDTSSGGLKQWLSTAAGAMTTANLFASAIEKGISAVTNFAAAIWNMDEATEEYRVSQIKLNTAFESAGHSGETTQKAFSGLYKVVGDLDRATEASQLMAKLARNTEDVAGWTTIATGVVGTFGDSLPVETLIESSNETAKVGKVVGTLADALNWAGISEDEFNESLARCAGTSERTALITETLAATYRDAADAYAKNASEIMNAREAQLRMMEAQAGVGDEISNLKAALSRTFAPALEAALGGVKNFVGWLGKMAEATARNTEAYTEMVNAIKTPLPTTSIEDAEAALEKLRARKEEIASMSPDELATNMALSTEYAKLGDQIRYAEEQLAAMKSGAEEAAQAAESLTISAGGMTVELQGSGLSAEEATSRLQAYTGAATDMFQAISTESQISYEQAVANLEANIQATTDFANNLTSIAGSLPPQLAELFAAGGPAVYAGVVSMLAEANAGTDVGLTQLNELWAQGGLAAVEAFTASLGMVPAETENPATIVAAQMEQDTSMEIAAEGVVDRTYTSLTSAVNSAGFDAAGSTAMNKFIQGMEARRSAVLATAQSIANAAANVINSALSGIGTGGGSYRAGGLDYVPHNNYPAMLHAGEAVLTAQEADEWRKGNSPSGGGSIVINQYISAVPQTPVELAAATEAYFEQARWAM